MKRTVWACWGEEAVPNLYPGTIEKTRNLEVFFFSLLFFVDGCQALRLNPLIPVYLEQGLGAGHQTQRGSSGHLCSFHLCHDTKRIH